MRFYQPVVIPLAALSFVLCATAAGAYSGKSTAKDLMVKALPDMKNKEVLFISDEFQPGQVLAPHKHPGPVIVYVLDGTFVSQMGGEEPVTYNAGEYWYEAPMHHHVLTKNPSKTDTAKLLAWMIIDKGGKPTIMDKGEKK